MNEAQDQEPGTSVRVRRRRRKKRSSSEEGTLLSRGVKALIFALMGAVAIALVSLLLVYPSSKGPGSGKDVELFIPAGEGMKAVSERLLQAGLIGSPRLFALYATFNGGASKIASGGHYLADDISPAELLKRLQRFGHAEHVKVTIPEGYNQFQIARRLQDQRICGQAAFLAATLDPELLRDLGLVGSAEGFLFPATYELAADSDPREVVRRLKSAFDQRYSQLEITHGLGRTMLVTELGWGTREIVTLASMVEREAMADDERPIIASVFLNRLRDASFNKKRFLQCDPTAGYGCLVLQGKIPACAGYSGKITHEINSAPENTYSTYTHQGLPPGPISNPGIKSIVAVLTPANTRFFYFVARGGGRHVFSETYEAHRRAVEELKNR